MKTVYLIEINPFLIKEKYQYTTQKDIVFLSKKDELIFQNPQVTGIRTLYCDKRIDKNDSSSISACIEKTQSLLMDSKVTKVYVFVHHEDYQKVYELLRPNIIASGNQFRSPSVAKETFLQQGNLYSIVHTYPNKDGVRSIEFSDIENEIYSVMVQTKVSPVQQQVTQVVTLSNTVTQFCLN